MREALLVLIAATAQAAVVRIEVSEEAQTGRYRRTTGTVHYAVDPRLAQNAGIVDIDKARRNALGLVEFSADLYLLEPDRPGGTLLVEIPNRGRRGLLDTFNRGDQFLLEQGFTLLWVGWQPDVEPRPEAMRLHVPVASGVTGPVRTDFIPERRVSSVPLAGAGHVAYQAAGGSRTLTVRDTITGERREIAPEAWRITAAGRVEMSAGFEPGRIYEVTYQARDPWIGGLGFAAVRDLVAHLKVQRKMKHAYAFGNSQSAMFLRAMIDEGFNEDERGGRVFDGVLSNVAGGRRISLNRRFAQPGRTAGPWRAFFSGTDVPPFSDRDIRARAKQAPKIFHTNSTYEYWGAAASLVHTTIDGSADAPPEANSRVYIFSGGQHGPSSFPPGRATTQNLTNPNDYRWALRALLVAMKRWVEDGVEPPASRYPTIGARDLVALADLRFPSVGGVRVPARVHTPEAGRTLVPAVDSDGNERAGLRLPEIEVPLATYTGWNLLASGELNNNTGSFIPFARTRAERTALRDPRLSIAERYGSREQYLTQFRAAAARLAREGYLLERDVAAVVSHATQLWDYVAAAPMGSSAR